LGIETAPISASSPRAAAMACDEECRNLAAITGEVLGES
jgi:hypothetical protein